MKLKLLIFITCFVKLVSSAGNGDCEVEALNFDKPPDAWIRPIKCNICWCPIASNTDLNTESYMVGYNKQEQRIYPGRILYNGATVPGQITETPNGFEFRSILNGKEVKVTQGFYYFKACDTRCYCAFINWQTPNFQKVKVYDPNFEEEWWAGLSFSTFKLSDGSFASSIGKAHSESKTFFYLDDNNKAQSKKVVQILQCSPKA